MTAYHLRMRIAAVASLAAACTWPMVSVEHAPIEWTGGHSGHYEKAGVGLYGKGCGEQFQRAVTGVPAAEELMRSCSHFSDGYLVATVGGFGSVLTAAIVDSTSDNPRVERVTGTVMIGGLIAAFAGFVLAGFATTKLRDAVRTYNATFER